ncbi:MAG: IS200/IS605 family transposase [Herpetosiphonaceae bacterium]|nr:IS200/IS605 family transposase [Herpetosiphonaceae bacterium]
MELRQSDKFYHTDRSIVYSCQYHVVFCPKYRRKVLSEAVAVRLKELVLSKQADYGYLLIEMAVLPDHVHLLLDVDPRVGVNGVVGKIKAFTSHELRNEFPWLKQRLPTLWTRSKFIASVGAVTLAVIQQYIEDQKGV